MNMAPEERETQAEQEQEELAGVGHTFTTSCRNAAAPLDDALARLASDVAGFRRQQEQLGDPLGPLDLSPQRKRQARNRERARAALRVRLEKAARALSSMLADLDTDNGASASSRGAVKIPLRGYLRTMAAIAWNALRHPLSTTTIDLLTGRVIARR